MQDKDDLFEFDSQTTEPETKTIQSLKRKSLIESNIEVIQSLGYELNLNLESDGKKYFVLYRGTRNGNELKSMMQNKSIYRQGCDESFDSLQLTDAQIQQTIVNHIGNNENAIIGATGVSSPFCSYTADKSIAQRFGGNIDNTIATYFSVRNRYEMKTFTPYTEHITTPETMSCEYYALYTYTHLLYNKV
jgi:hypothetical protein